MSYTIRGRLILFVALGLLCGRVAAAAPIGYTDRAAYDAATVGLTGLNTLDFESLPTGVMGLGPIQGIMFAFNIDGFDPSVVDDFDTTSGTHSLGTTGDGIFLAGDSFTMTFAPTNALGLYVIAADLIFAGDFALTVPGGSINNSATTDSGFPGTLGDGGKVFFLGLVDPTTPFTTATFSSGLGFPADFVFNIDDITGQIDSPTPSEVPEPATLVLVASGLAAAFRSRRKRDRLKP